MRESYDVAIVGYGPVGQALAILLGQCGWNVGVFEKQPSPYPLPRAVHFDHEIGRILQATGVATDLAAMTEPAYIYEWRNAAGETLLRFGRKGASLSGWPESNMFAQPELERLLDARARSLPSVEVHRGCDVVGIRPGTDDVEIGAVDAGGKRVTVRSRYVVGCDGANSFVRQHLGATVTDLGFYFDWLIVDLIPHDQRIWEPLNWQLCDPARPTTLVSGGPGRRRWEFMRLPGESIEDLNTEETAWRLLGSWGMTPENATLERHAVYTFQACWVDTWRRGRVLIAGDAAHLMPPFAGQGMCSGLRDAVNLAWKLDHVLQGKAPDALLDTYTSERQPNVSAVIHFSIELGKVICVDDPQQAAARDAQMIAAQKQTRLSTPPPPPSIGPGLLLPGDPWAGQLFVQGQVSRGDAAGLCDDVVGRGWTLLSPSFDPVTRLDSDAAAFFASIGGISAQVGRHGPIRDVNGCYAEWFEHAGVAVVLQRPDFYVFGTAATAGDIGQLVGGLQALLKIH
jgi:2-polyprenyl-6-methoxyphenol hydroxylase-like FAD-dependent oxidoreductase